MTNLEAFKAILEGTFTDDQLKIWLINNSLNPDDTYVKKNARLLDMAKIDSILLLISTEQSVRELDYLVTNRSVADLLDLIGALYAKWGMKNPLEKNKVRSANVW